MATQREQVRSFLQTAGIFGVRMTRIAAELQIPSASVRRIVGELRRAHKIERVGTRIRFQQTV